MTYIEKDLPIELLNPVAMSEGNSKKPVYQMHKWWARRLGSVFRMITLAAFSERSESATNIWDKFCQGYDLRGKIVLDPFMGGGTTVVEALRLGCKVVGVDINPVAWFVTKKEVEPADLAKLDVAFKELEQTAGDRIRRYYLTTCPRHHTSEVMYYFWVKTADCPTCHKKVRIFPNFELSRRDNVSVFFCSRCLQIIETSKYSRHTRCHECNNIFDPRRGVSRRGSFTCPSCHTEQRVLNIVQQKGAALEFELHALEGYCQICGRFFKRVDEDDLKLWRQAKAEFELKANSLLFPRQAIPAEGRSDPRPINHGYAYFYQMFNQRQLLCLSILLEHILKIPDPNIRELMLIAFSDSLDANNMFCKYEVGWHKVSVFFGLHAFHPIERPAENNVWGTAFGRGTFAKCFEKMRRAKAFCQSPYERLLAAGGRRYSRRTGHERIEGYPVRNYEELVGTDHGVLLRCQSSEDLSFIPDKSVDAVITDPPYFDNVQYSELADFFYVWLRLGLKDVYDWFKPELSGRGSEIVKNDKLGKTMEFFNQGLKRVFTECHRVLRDDGLLIFTFHHNKVWAWEGIARLLLESGFYITSTPVVRSEGKSGFHSSKGNIRYDLIIVCRKSPAPFAEHAWSSMKGAALEDAVQWTRRTLDSGMAVNEVDVFAIIMGKTIERYTRALANGAEATDRPTLAEALKEMSSLTSLVAPCGEDNCGTAKQTYGQSIKQLRLFIMESESKYGVAKTRSRVPVSQDGTESAIASESFSKDDSS